LHGEGAASDWVQGAEIGQEIVVLGPGGGWDVPQDGDWYVLAADESSIPAAGQVLEALPKPPHAVLVEVAGPVDERPLPAVDPSSVTWLHRGDAPAKAGTCLEDAVRALELPEGRG